MIIEMEKKQNNRSCNILTKPCDKCGDLCASENQKSENQLKTQLFNQTGDLYFFNNENLCFGCFFKAKVRGK